MFNYLKRLFTNQAGGEAAAYWLAVKCSRCGEIIRGRVDLNNELSPDYGDSDDPSGYVCRKVLIGQQRCFQPIEVALKFDVNRKLIERSVSGGEFVDL